MDLGTKLIVNLVIAIAIILVCIMLFKVNATIALILASIYMGVASGIEILETITLIGDGFGSMMASMGLPIGLGVILGQLLSDSGGANVIAETIVRKFPAEKSLYALAFTGFILSIPVFFDVTFIILIPIGIAIARQINKPMAYITGVLTAGATTAHCIVPPTPNPLAAPDIFGFNLGTMVIAGLIFGIITVLGTVFIYTKIHDKGIWNSEKDINHSSTVVEELEAAAAQNDRERPGFWVSLIPIFFPIICILSGTVASALVGEENIPLICQVLGTKIVALLVGALAAYIVGYKYIGKEKIENSCGEALKAAGVVLLITGAGGSFGTVIKATDIGTVLVDKLGIDSSSKIAILFLAFFIGFIFRIAQGSGTVAGITSMTIMATISGTVALHPVYIAMACLSGGNSVGHVNDSGFWVATNLSGLSVTGGLKTYTLASFISAVFIFLIALVGAVILPMA
jgi:gluconate transporter